MTLFDNGNTRISPPPKGLGSNCGPADCNSRGMVLDVNEVNMEATPLLSADLGVYCVALGSAQLLSDGNYFFAPGQYISHGGPYSFAIEILPTPGTIVGTQVLNLQGTKRYRAWQMLSMYAPPAT
jgi:hypothetical protein